MHYITSLSLLLLFVACKPSEPQPPTEVPPSIDSTAATYNTKPYYFPVEELKEGKVYEYSLMQDSAAYISHYWELQSTQDERGETFLRWKRYNPYFKQDQYIKEWIVQDGVVTTAYEIIIRDSSQTPKRYVNNIDQSIVYPFRASLDTSLAYRFSCTLTLPPDFVTVRLIRDRQFSQPLVYPYGNKKVPAVAFACTDLYDLEDTSEGGFWERRTASIEIYAQGIGLVYTEEKKPGGAASQITQLTNIYSLSEFEALKNQREQ